MSHIRRITVLVVWHTVASGQAVDLSPILPPPDPSTDAIRRAIETGQLGRADTLAASLAAPARELWQGILAITRNDSKTAIRHLRKADHPKALGVAYYLAGQHLLFRQQMAEAMRREPVDFGPYYLLGRHYDSDVDNAEEAVRWLQLAHQRNPDYANVRSYLGNCLERLGRTEEAEAAYNASAGVAQSQLGLARLRFGAGDLTSALQFVQKAIALDAKDARALKLQARIFVSLQRPRDAIAALEAAASVAPRDASIRYQLARLHREAGEAARSESALREFERLRAIYGTAP